MTQLVRHGIHCLGRAIREEAGESLYQTVESLRQRLKGLRSADPEQTRKELEAAYQDLKSRSAEEQLAVAHSFALMLELINCCENAYRTFRLRENPDAPAECGARSIVYVLTAHPTEARAPECVEVFRRIQDRLLEALERGYHRIELNLLPLLKLAWKIPMAKQDQPTVRDEANHLYMTVLHPDRLKALLQGHLDGTPVFLRSWVGGDKDGHPGVDHTSLVESLNLSRVHILFAIEERFHSIEDNLTLLLASASRDKASGLLEKMAEIRAQTRNLREILPGDGERVRKFRRQIEELRGTYDKLMGSPTRNSAELAQLLHIFPAFVVPLELREGADLIRQAETEEDLAIVQMLRTIGEISRGGDPKWYVRGLIISMVSESADLVAAGKLLKRTLGEISLPVIPLLEKEQALREATDIIGGALDHPIFKGVVEGAWRGHFEVMLGYSDSAKEIGALPSRVLISQAMEEVDGYFLSRGITPVFFHGAGGSVARGGGSIYEQISWWPASSLKIYKVTIQGEMVQRGFASAEIVESQLKKIGKISKAILSGRVGENADRGPVEDFAEVVKRKYKEQFTSAQFLDVIQRATPYSYLSELKLGSRPAKRKGEFSLDTIRAIPWVLCWTQTRVLFPTWWGVGSAWEELSDRQQFEIKVAFEKDKLFGSFVKMLGFTLAKVELPVWDFLLYHSSLDPKIQQETSEAFHREHVKALKFMEEVTGESKLLWFRPWLGQSIRLRSSMIHVLNLTQQIAVEQKDQRLLRESVTGIACGMLTTG